MNIIRHCGIYTHIGAYETMEEAKKAYEVCADMLFSQHARKEINQ